MLRGNDSEWSQGEAPQLKSPWPTFVFLCLNRWVSVFPLLFFLLNICVYLQQFVCWPFPVHHLLFCWQVAGRFRFGCCACRDAHSSPVHSTLSGAQVRERYEGCSRRSRKNLTDGIWKMNMFTLIHLSMSLVRWFLCLVPITTSELSGDLYRCCWWKPIWGSNGNLVQDSGGKSAWLSCF